MQTLKLAVKIINHRIATELPPNVPDGDAEVVIHYPVGVVDEVEDARRRHLELLYRDIDQSGQATLTSGQINQMVAEERASWGGERAVLPGCMHCH